jgi:hypothetical protein
MTLAAEKNAKRDEAETTLKSAAKLVRAKDYDSALLLLNKLTEDLPAMIASSKDLLKGVSENLSS